MNNFAKKMDNKLNGKIFPINKIFNFLNLKINFEILYTFYFNILLYKLN